LLAEIGFTPAEIRELQTKYGSEVSEYYREPGYLVSVVVGRLKAIRPKVKAGRPPSKVVAARRERERPLFEEGNKLRSISTQLKIPIGTVKDDFRLWKSRNN